MLPVRLDIPLNEKWRVSMIENPPQWTLERKKTWKGQVQWQAVSFCQTKAALLRSIHEKVERGAAFYRGSENLAVDAAAMAKLAEFPEKIS
jgi:hypothetical protein